VEPGHEDEEDQADGHVDHDLVLLQSREHALNGRGRVRPVGAYRPTDSSKSSCRCTA
jgi:hypothetical protein